MVLSRFELWQKNRVKKLTIPIALGIPPLLYGWLGETFYFTTIFNKHKHKHKYRFGTCTVYETHAAWYMEPKYHRKMDLNLRNDWFRRREKIHPNDIPSRLKIDRNKARKSTQIRLFTHKRHLNISVKIKSISLDLILYLLALTHSIFPGSVLDKLHIKVFQTYQTLINSDKM